MSHDDGDEIDINLLNSINTRAWSSALAKEMTRKRNIEALFADTALRVRTHNEWMALPWRVRVWRTIRPRIEAVRVRLGEIIAGKKFDY